MQDLVIKSYGDLDFHKTIGELIRQHSENKEDIREVAKQFIDQEDVHDILDLGCGYGWFEESLPNGFRSILGIDCLEANECGFLAVAKKIAATALFRQMLLPAPLDVVPESLDLVIAAYSLYFFPGILSEVRRILRPQGTFLIITHSASMLEEGEEFFNFSNLRQVINNFSAENGTKLLKQYFGHVTEIDYVNSLIFSRDERDDLAKYIDFKREFISKDVSPAVMKAKMIYELETRGTMRFNKNDRIFMARK
jgi:SAM-dependent methyltransferase